ncbi:MAG: helix-turn-helix domain-containing protein [Solirubrobacterales bacterium]
MIVSKKELGLLIKKARSLKSDKYGNLYTQKMLAENIEKSQSYVGDIESGRTYPSFVMLLNIAQACEVSINFFDPGFKEENKISSEFADIREIISFITSLKVFQNYVGIDFEKLSSKEIDEFNKDVLNQLKLISYKYR